MSDYVIDIETDGIQATRIHCMVLDNGTCFTYYGDMQEFLDSLTAEDRIIGHNFQRYDKPTLERILGITIKAKIIDTLAISWYLFPSRARHGLEYWGEDFGIPKPVITDWNLLSLEEYTHRCKEDVRINKKLWDLQLSMLNKIYDDKPEPLIRYLSFKMKMAELQEKSMWKLDVEGANTLLLELETKHEAASLELSKVMPKVAKVAKRSKPKEPFKQDGSLSVTGSRWQALCEKNNKPVQYTGVIEVVIGHNDPNPSSSVQIKEWLFSLGWKPTTFNYVADKEKIPQVKTKDGELCKSILKLSDLHPEVLVLDSMAVVKHRIGLVRGLLKNDRDGFVTASVQGLTNTLRYKHAICVNLPSARKPYGLEIRGLLTAREGSELLGSDMCSLEDRVKQHYMWEYDPEYVKEMSTEGFDPHLDLALSAKAITKEQADAYKRGEKTEAITQLRHNFKSGNYALQYGCGIQTLARQLGIKQDEAQVISDAYWDRNKSVVSIAESMITKDITKTINKVTTKMTWQYNPVSKLWYSLRSDKDRFSTLCQGTGTYVFDMWVAYILREREQITANFHDEIVLEVKKGNRDKCIKLLRKSIQEVNNLLSLNRELEVDIQFGKNYADIH